MKQPSQERTLLWVWFSLGLLVTAIIAYAVGYLMFEQINWDHSISKSRTKKIATGSKIQTICSISRRQARSEPARLAQGYGR